jgi:polysaccharide export outer membrane protein
LTIYGRRDNVKVIRELDGKRTTYQLDLRSSNIYDSPAYYLQQNDVIYVEPNGTRAGQSSVNENNWKSVSLWMSMASFLMSVIVLVVK